MSGKHPCYFVLIIAVGAVLTPAFAEEDRSQHVAAMDKTQSIAEAETLAEGCRLRLNTQLRDAMRADVLSKIDSSTFDSMERFARTYTLDLLKNHQFCARALNLFGADGEKVKDLLLAPEE